MYCCLVLLHKYKCHTHHAYIMHIKHQSDFFSGFAPDYILKHFYTHGKVEDIYMRTHWHVTGCSVLLFCLSNRE